LFVERGRQPVLTGPKRLRALLRPVKGAAWFFRGGRERVLKSFADKKGGSEVSNRQKASDGNGKKPVFLTY